MITRVKGQLAALYLFVYDIAVVNLSFFLALLIRFDCRFSRIPEEYLYAWVLFTPIYTLFCMITFSVLKLYQSIWKFASYSELARCSMAAFVTGMFHTIVITACYKRMPLTYYAFGIMIQFLLTVGIRFSYRFVLLERSRRAGKPETNVMLIGAGDAGRIIMRDTNSSAELNERVQCIIDDDPSKWNKYIDGTKVVGGRDDILLNVEKYHIDKIYIAMPSATVTQKREILNICKESGCELRDLPGVYQLRNGDVHLSDLKKVEIEDLLGREPIRVDMSAIFEQIKDKTILVTGGGGSIGSELCRQIAAHQPKQLIIFDVYENNAYDIQQELKKKYPNMNLEVLIGSVRDSRRLNQVFGTYKPDIVYHAAAHKHVPLMEDSPCESIKNNAIGTYKTAYAALMNGTRKFVLISTDKAVNPTNIMGASKRLCEMVIQTFDKMVREGTPEKLPRLFEHEEHIEGGGDIKASFPKELKTDFVAVRFGNVLGSNGSVLPIFMEQIKNGGPVTVTHPDIIRYFMTIPEAVSLVLQAGVYARGGEIFVLDMGEPVKIDTLARNLIKLSGLKPDEDIEIAYTGLRPGEKLYEEKLMDEEGLKRTKNELIHIGKPIPFDYEMFVKQLDELMDLAYENDDKIKEYVKEVVGTYQPA